MDVLAKPTVTIRQAQIQDLPEIVGCLKVFFLETPWGVLRPDPDLIYTAEWLMKLDSRSQLFVATDDENIIGLCGGTIVDFPMIADLPYLWEWCWWVKKEHRHTDTARRLWSCLTEWAKQNGAKGSVYGKAEAQSVQTFTETLQWRFWP